MQLIEVPSGSILGLEGDMENCVYFIATGKLKVYKHASDLQSATAPQVLVVYSSGLSFTACSSLTIGLAVCSLPRGVLWRLVSSDW